ncbi:hypothetical protein EVAR_73838_1 [Eumeta japonica]|uniref:Uncharacterized protein n=1 Tax=Eumeta variegata TaxID=151549 RepID=A0A4C1TDU2_EUMVA|nr:hypothetical protein EVAR_73838_1 [Eumeta japonica]
MSSESLRNKRLAVLFEACGMSSSRFLSSLLQSARLFVDETMSRNSKQQYSNFDIGSRSSSLDVRRITSRRISSRKRFCRILYILLIIVMASVVCGRCLSSTRTHRPMEWKRDRCVTSRTLRPIVPLYCSALSLARSA